jgi:ribosomal protein L11 methyltransferase
VDPSAALILSFPDSATPADRDRLVATLADSGLVAIHENDLTNPSKWVAHFADAASRNSAARTIQSTPEYRDIQIEAADIEDEDWARRTQADLGSVRIGGIIVAPPWDMPAGGPETVIIIEPSRGFGTGHHQSTRLCLALLQTRELRRRRVIDVGTGSGVLAIAAAALGAPAVSAIDVDPDAVENARENVARNGVADVVEIHVGDLATTTLVAADVVTANLTGSLLERHAANLVRLVKPGGLLIAAGFTIDERDRVAVAFEPRLTISEIAEEDGWIGVVLSQPGISPTPR